MTNPCFSLKRAAVLILGFVLSTILASAQTQNSASAASSKGGRGPKIAFTFDDLPAHSALPPGTTREEIAQKIVRALHDAKLPPVYGFVNAAALEQKPEDIAVLKIWRDAGNPLGNHTWSHMNLGQHSVQEFEEEITKNEPVLAKEVKKGDWHWFRYPYLSEGDTPEKREAIREFLAERGYKIAAVTMSFGDYMWNEPYARCKAKGDSQAVAQLESTYLKAADDSIAHFRDLSHRVEGRDIPYVLLMHIGALDAELMPKLLELYKSRGFQFVTLQQAEQDPFYSAETNLHLNAGPDTLEKAAAAKGITLPSRPAPPLQFDTLCR